jgi:hypothetical protein
MCMGKICIGAQLTSMPVNLELDLLAIIVKSQLNTWALNKLVDQSNLHYAKGVDKTFKCAQSADQIVLQCDPEL